MSKDGFLYKILEKKCKENDNKITRKHAKSISAVGYGVQKFRKAMSTILFGAAVVTGAYANGYIGHDQTVEGSKKDASVEYMQPTTFGLEFTTFLKDKTYNISNPAEAIYNFYVDCLKFSTCGLSESEYRSYFKDSKLTEYGQKSIINIALFKVKEIGDSIYVFSNKKTLLGSDMLYKIKPFSSPANRFAKREIK
jgi:hypothetical protein